MDFDFRFNAEGLIPAIVQQALASQHHYGRVLMMGWMNRESIEQSLSKGFMHYWSRSRNKLWLKGETSGNVQKIIRWFVDCDRDTLLFFVDQKGSACHSGSQSCFFSELDAKQGTVIPPKGYLSTSEGDFSKKESER
ncbi:Phosphoribosyl-AMP cyclohydrolase [Candidatus Xiphinematobacter sp. Idaho Grape]|uniref:phosphoribosyl-AMP cyclohydrolase n=1 Tax=Candidatus Xiphinematobacter sp. Idaho Grape TaxID=1704307 RepID=UPI000705A236|nr:phosphoribosyl-AMP cyclohydrolase [Candidatus Xiphinematobacter sp. Idaho Grape]ALJ56694.1 Phosphoribosyl-AMP cyclohydrolase [Candidatus Xiphinematobacter sp. Idaho Grape]